MVSFFTAGSWEKDTIFGAASKIFGASYFVTALEHTNYHSFYKWTKILTLETTLFALKMMVKSGLDFEILRAP